jgi:hypothetical protein
VLHIDCSDIWKLAGNAIVRSQGWDVFLDGKGVEFVSLAGYSKMDRGYSLQNEMRRRFSHKILGGSVSRVLTDKPL